MREPRPFHHQPYQHTSPPHLLSASHEVHLSPIRQKKKKSSRVAVRCGQSRMLIKHGAQISRIQHRESGWVWEISSLLLHRFSTRESGWVWEISSLLLHRFSTGSLAGSGRLAVSSCTDLAQGSLAGSGRLAVSSCTDLSHRACLEMGD